MMSKLSALVFTFLAISLFSPLKQVQALGEETQVNKITIPKEASTTVSAQVGGLLFDIEGLTSSFAQVEFSSSQGNINLVTLADQEGVFRFVNALMPFSTGDFCFTAIDTQQRASAPVCFAPPPAYSYTNIRGIILPPTLALDKGVFLQGEDVAAFGATTPDSPVKIFLFEDENVSFWELLDVFPFLVQASPFQVLAREGPNYSVQTDSEGEFSLNLPTYKSTVWKLFVGTTRTQLGDNPSPRSNIIQFAALSWWQWWLLRLAYYLKSAFRSPITIILILLIAIGTMTTLLIRNKKLSSRTTEMLKSPSGETPTR